MPSLMEEMMTTQQTLHHTAMTFLRETYGQHLSNGHNMLINRCVAHLQNISDITTERAIRISAQALGELESAGKVSIDISCSTSFMIILRLNSGETLALTAADLFDAARHHAIKVAH